MIIVIEDDVALNKLIQLELGDYGFHSKGLYSGREALKWIAENHSSDNFYLFDYELKDISAIDVIKELKKDIVDLPFLVITGKGNEQLAVEMMQLGAYDYIIKEVTFLNIIPHKLKVAIEKNSLKAELEESRRIIADNERKYRSIFTNIQEVYFELKLPTLEILEISASIKKVFGRERELTIGKSITELLKHTVESAEIETIFNKHLDYSDLEVIIKKIDGKTKAGSVNYTTVKSNGEKRIIGTIHDASQKMKDEARVMSKIIKAEEDERSRLADDLHDGLGPLLSAIKINVNKLGKGDVSEKNKNLVNISKAYLDEAIGSIREITDNLMPSVIYDFGLTKAMELYIDKLHHADDYTITYSDNLTERLDSTIEIVLYRSLMEFINNGIKHSGGTKIDVTLRNENNEVVVYYSDDGIGLNHEKINVITENSGWGLKSVIRRIKSINGSCEFVEDKVGANIIIRIRA